MSNLLQDLRYAIRMLIRAPGFTVFAVLTLALGIGATTTVFSLLYALFLRPLPVEDSQQVFHISHKLRWRGEAEASGGFAMSFQDYLYFRQHNTVFSQLAAHYSTAPLSLEADAEVQGVNGAVVTANYFTLLRLKPALGRFFSEEEGAVAERGPVAVLSHSLWRTRFGGDAQVLGKSIRLNGEKFTIIGVAPHRFSGFHGGAELAVWIPSSMFRVGFRYCNVAERDCRPILLTARLKPGQTADAALAEMSLLAGQLEAQYPETNKGRGIFMASANGWGSRERAPGELAVKVLGVATGIVLLIASANLAGLLLARGIQRRKEIAVRSALGAGRARLVRQLLTESVLLSLLGGSAGLVVAIWANEIVAGFFGVTYSGFRMNLTLDLHPVILAGTVGISLLTAVGFGLAPSLQASRPDMIAALKGEAPGSGRRSPLRGGLVVVQVALAVLLLTGAGLVARSLQNIYRGPGFDPGQVVLLRIRPTLLAYDGPKAFSELRDIHRRLEATPGVVAVSPAEYLPVGFSGNTVGVWLPGSEPARREDAERASVNAVGPGFFKTLRMELLEGHDFGEQDRWGAPLVAVVNDLLARRYWPGQSAIGQTLIADGQPYNIIGVVRDAQYYSDLEPPRPFFYPNFWQRDPNDKLQWDSRTHVRVAGDPAGMLPVLLREVAAVDAALPLSEAYPMTERLKFAFAPVRMATTALSFFGALAVFLSALGLYGVLAFAVSQRTREIGIRMALGAQPGNVMRMVLRQGALLALAGLGIGLSAAMLSSRMLASLLYGVPAHDAATFLQTSAVLLSVALLACWLPARRATKVDPMTALRYE